MIDLIRRRFLGLSLAVFPGAALARAGAGSPSIQSVLRRNALARGGRTADAITSYEAVMEIVEGYTVTGWYRANRAGHMRIDAYADGKRVFSEGVDDDGSWEWPGGKPAPSPSPIAARGVLERGVELNLYSLQAQAARGATVTLAGRETLDGVRYHVVRRVGADGAELFFYIDPVSWQIARRRDVRALHPGVDPSVKWLENRYDDYRPVEGVMTSFTSRQIDLRTGKVAQTTTVKRQSYNRSPETLSLARTFDGMPAPAG